MNSETRNYIIHFIMDLTDRLHNRSGVPALLLKHYNSFSISEEECMELATQFPEYQFIYHQFNVDRMLSAYEPFLDWIAEAFSSQDKVDVDTFMDMCQVYSLHREVIRAYLLGLPITRVEDFIYNEVPFEKEQMIQAIVNMICFFSKDRPLIIVFNKLHRCGCSTLNILLRLFKERNGRIGIFATYNDLITPDSHMSEEWEKLLKIAAEDRCILDWGFSTSLSSGKQTRTFTPRADQFAQYMISLNVMYLTVALKQANYFASLLHRKLLIGEIEIDEDEKYQFYLLYTKIFILSGDISNSLILCSTLDSMNAGHKSSQKQFYVSFLSALAHTYNGQAGIAQDLADQCLYHAKKTGDAFTIFRAKLLKHMTIFSGWNDIWLCELDYGVDPALLEEARQYNYRNHLAHILVYACDNNPEIYSSLERIKKNLTTFQKGIEIAAELGNSFLLLSAYRKNLMIASTNGYFDISRYYAIEKIQPLVIKTNNRFEEGNVYNDLGYNSSATEKYLAANEYFNQALSIFCDLNKIEYIGETLYNMAINGIMAEDYPFAYNCLDQVIAIINIFHSESIRVAHISKVLGLQALCSIRMDNLYNCRMCLHTAYQFLEHIVRENSDMAHFTYWDDDLFLYHLCSGMVAAHEGNDVKAKKEYVLAYLFGGQEKGGSVFYYNMYAEEMALLYQKMGEEEKAQEVLAKCISYFDEKGYHNKQKRMIAIRDHKPYENQPLHLGFTVPGIMEKIEKLITDNSNNWVMHTYQRKITYLTSWQKLQNSVFNSVSELISHSASSLKSEFNFDHLIFVRMLNQTPVILYNDSETELDQSKLEILVSYFCHNRTTFTTSKLNRNYFEYESITSLFDQSHLCAMMGVPLFVNEQLGAFALAYILLNDNWGAASNGIVIEQSEAAIFEVLFRQLTDSIDRLESHRKIQRQNAQLNRLNIKLKQSAISDQLTGLLNRQGMKELLVEEVNLAKRAKDDAQMTVIYCDLDKFKHCNDTFGHAVGDQILVAFSKLLSRVSQHQGYAIRYGGDEFILLLTHASRRRVEETVHEIYDTLERTEGFRKEIEKVTNTPVSIPPTEQVSTSIGIAFACGAPEADLVFDALQKADKALYYVKEHGKRHFEFYEDIEGQLS